jgi:hypothetical protein
VVADESVACTARQLARTWPIGPIDDDASRLKLSDQPSHDFVFESKCVSSFEDFGSCQGAIEGSHEVCHRGGDVVDHDRVGDVDAELKSSGITPDAT